MKYIAFLRAVNVGGRVVKMDELKKLFALPGIKNISTFIQSGNVIFETTETDEKKLQQKIEAKLLKALGYEVAVFLFTFPELKKVIDKNPFENEMEEKTLYVTFLSEKPAKENVALLETLKAKEEQVRISGTNAYLLFPPKTYGETKLSNAMLEKKLKVKATTRNWSTLNKILALDK